MSESASTRVPPARPLSAASAAAHPAWRDPRPMLERTLQEWDHGCRHGQLGPDLWLFGYASLIWRPEFPSDEHRAATVHGWHRSLQMHSRINRGRRSAPGSCSRCSRAGPAEAWCTESGGTGRSPSCVACGTARCPTASTTPAGWECRTAHGTVKALGFTLSRRSPAWAGSLDEAQMLDVLREARGRFGTTLDYLVETARCLRERGIRDREIERLMRLARQGGLAA